VFLDAKGEGDDVAVLELTPKAGDEESFFQSVRIYMRGERLLPYRIRLKTDAESEVVIEVADYRVNAPIDQSKTQFLVPEGTLIVDNGAPIETVGRGGKWIPETAPLAQTPTVQGPGQENPK
ncbi:MAG TPA: hypothetical protein HPP83_04960, partial [Candidatus Hydrogenedentes bacterium]|nr:hypothetical protein [Candidatus Hydrogenedentota bacterium]